jgi:hypothetical protein
MPDWKFAIRRQLHSLQLTPTREAAIIEEKEDKYYEYVSLFSLFSFIS